ncbi:uncharacterized protein TRIVIDRAFT_62794 [Trichoderma virens Gv29-8]|uniref:Uncharacterized protein n=1 Tax=Hypocrea virens (strain Gv29-8 / FGSC 10586) TaxID=413071 RepID=G9MF38_HYPVG|nr:uncharacterized protein TRIVIDRAFT_62794 [Trichoderma virens Gv29-8]EHK27004.1 hypothetical protein TRIVIDRAFT_62794 [Trichoderma virens Gv29-8]
MRNEELLFFAAGTQTQSVENRHLRAAVGARAVSRPDPAPEGRGERKEERGGSALTMGVESRGGRRRVQVRTKGRAKKQDDEREEREERQTGGDCRGGEDRESLGFSASEDDRRAGAVAGTRRVQMVALQGAPALLDALDSCSGLPSAEAEGMRCEGEALDYWNQCDTLSREAAALPSGWCLYYGLFSLLERYLRYQYASSSGSVLSGTRPVKMTMSRKAHVFLPTYIPYSQGSSPTPYEHMQLGTSKWRLCIRINHGSQTSPLWRAQTPPSHADGRDDEADTRKGGTSYTPTKIPSVNETGLLSHTASTSQVHANSSTARGIEHSIPSTCVFSLLFTNGSRAFPSAHCLIGTLAVLPWHLAVALCPPNGMD